MGYPFGQNFTYNFYPLVDEKPAAGIPTQTPSIYLFTVKPSRDDAQNGTGAIQTISTWEAHGAGYRFTVSAINDPDTDSDSDKYIYWIAVNFVLKTAGQVQTVIRQLDMQRVSGHHKTITVTCEDVKSYQPSVVAYASDPELQTHILLATEEIKAKLLNKGYEWARIWRTDVLNLVVVTRALALVMFSQIQQLGDKFEVKFKEYDKISADLLASVQFETTNLQKTEPIKAEKATTEIMFIR